MGNTTEFIIGTMGYLAGQILLVIALFDTMICTVGIGVAAIANISRNHRKWTAKDRIYIITKESSMIFLSIASSALAINVYLMMARML